MTDYFAIFGEPRAPWLDAEVLKEKFHALSATLHPDASANTKTASEKNDAALCADFATLNSAYQILRDPAARLRHLIELDFPQLLSRGDASNIPPELIERFAQVGKLRQRTKQFFQKQKQAANPLATALLSSEKFALLDELQQLVAALENEQAQFDEELKMLGANWPNADSAARLAQIYQRLAFGGKWSRQLREDLLQLSV